MFRILCVADFDSYKGDDFLKRIQLLCKAGVDEILLRAKGLNEADFYNLARVVAQICENYRKKFIINQFFDVACKLKSDFWLTSAQLDFFKNHGVFLDEFRKIAKIYAPAHDIEQAKISATIADVFVASHIFATSCKVGLEPKGLNFISELKNLNKEIYALGGLDNQNYKNAIKAGASGICFMSLAMNGDINEIKDIVKNKNI
ncbi:thiamine phosphate synthase [Campylobacter concisus]|uniref:Thiamine phosphate synthase n=1 Tax=Campylobacter concisus TaxID=199 RepID=A0A1Y5MU27_9BACT|nr:thiamine phosphate synthase [Campylobacter concisus]OUT12058.1 thiamine phosphate synthase [Campylobacter concisus]